MTRGCRSSGKSSGTSKEFYPPFHRSKERLLLTICKDSNSFRALAIPTRHSARVAPVFSRLAMAQGLQPGVTDEVARNGALSRITSARGFLERPFAFSPSTPNLKYSIDSEQCGPTPARVFRAHQGRFASAAWPPRHRSSGKRRTPRVPSALFR